MRIIGGARRGLRLAEVGAGDTGAHLRPTSDRVREAIFNVLLGGRYGDPVTGGHVLDLFAGTGALGLEALSRGAAAVTFVDSGRVALGLLRDNLRRMGAEAEVLAVPAARIPPNRGPAAGLVFLDPPYGAGLGAAALLAARAGGWVAPGAVVVWEEESPQDAPEGFTRAELRRYGGTEVTFLRAD